ncbi:polysaccharide deacetylase family protein [Apibacter raozihei]|uniref:polysaccharide deacetylase family protein n=1 Tax=Apibacter raozihei TaxID=2500547 RepID=UPI000FE3C624|nr:polysaccharide deacetylase family protein [Apibacter raozihei]
MKTIYYTLLFTYFIALGCKKETVKNYSSNYNDTTVSTVKEKDSSTLTDTIKKNSDLPVDNEEKESQQEMTTSAIDSSKYYIYFTLDDGPQPGTRICKNILKENNVRATFFMVGAHNEGKERNDLVDSINNDQLFIVSNHSNTHAHNKYALFYSKPTSSFQDFITAENKLNIKHKIARLPGRNTWAIGNKVKGEPSAFAVAKKLDSAGYKVYGWDLEWRFIHGNIPLESASQMVKNVESKLKSGKTFMPKSIVILVHDRMFQRPQYADSLRKFITALKQNDKYIFETLDKYPTLTSIDKKPLEKK